MAKTSNIDSMISRADFVEDKNKTAMNQIKVLPLHKIISLFIM